MQAAVTVTPSGGILIENAADATDVAQAFSRDLGAGLLHLATESLKASLGPELAWLRSIAQLYLTRLCRLPDLEEAKSLDPILPPSRDDLEAIVLQAPLLRGLEYVSADALSAWWTSLDQAVRKEVGESGTSAARWLRERQSVWRLVGRVTFHLAENKRDLENPFAFLATYAHRLSASGTVQHLPLGRALQEYGSAKDKQTLLSLLTPIHRAAERLTWVKQLVEDADVYHPIAWGIDAAYRFLRDVPALEESGLIVRIPDWWKPNRPARPTVSVTVGGQKKSALNADALLDFQVDVTLDGEPLTQSELEQVLSSGGGLVSLRGRWVEADGDKLRQALDHWRAVENGSADGMTFAKAMRLIAGVPTADQPDDAIPEAVSEWAGVRPGEWLRETLSQLRGEGGARFSPPASLQAQLRPYQLEGVRWLRFVVRLGLGACLADDMGLGKTVQVLALLLALKAEEKSPGVSLLIVPATLIANWKAEAARFAPSLRLHVAHPSESAVASPPDALESGQVDLVITSYAMSARIDWLKAREWRLVILDEAQAVKNSGTRQARAAKSFRASARVAMTGTPIENRLSDLWSLFDFINPGLLGSGKDFSRLVKGLGDSPQGYAPLRKLVSPYILRRLKTDRSIIADLPDKTEVSAYCGLSREQAALYEQSVRELGNKLGDLTGIERRGIVLAYLMRFKQICNHPAQWLGDGRFEPDRSAKFARLAQICQELAERQERALVFTQFREMTAPLADFLAGIFGRTGLVLHGATAVKQRQTLVDQFQREGGPPFFVLSIKAGGTGLNLTAASQVIHFDRWWNPAVENQATDRAFRIGQKRNVLVHKFVCTGTVEEKIDAMLADKRKLSACVVGGEAGAEAALTELSDRELMDLVSLDIRRAGGE